MFIFGLKSNKIKTVLCLFAFICLGRVWTQSPEVFCTNEDREIFNRIVLELDPLPSYPIGRTMVATGRTFLDTPYVPGTLEVGSPERLVVNFRGMDCTTFVENVLAFSRMVQVGRKDWDAYLAELEQLRYRDGDLRGYASRLHYFTDWIQNNAQKGLLEDVTTRIGGVLRDKRINFMGTHPDLYPALASEEELRSIKQVEDSLSARAFYLVPQHSVRSQEYLIEEGDIIALATSIPGLDVTHTGIALRKDNGRIYLLHASTQGKVMVSEEPLADYLEDINSNVGILVVRPLEPDS